MNHKKLDETLDKIENALVKAASAIEKQNKMITELSKALIVFKNQALHGTKN